jgi:ribonuclease HI
MSVETDVSFWRIIANWLWVPLAAAVAGLWLLASQRFQRVEDMADAALTKEAFDGYVKRSEKSRETLWEEVKKLREDQRNMERLAADRHEKLLQAIYSIRRGQGSQ